MATSSRCIRWLHLSDFHFRAVPRSSERESFEALVAEVAHAVAADRRPDFVFVTGDIAWSGAEAEFGVATEWLHRLRQQANLPDAQRWFFVPGNHDVDRRQVPELIRARLDSIDGEEALERLLPECAHTGLDRFHEFCDAFRGVKRPPTARYRWTDVVQVGELRAAVVQLNSAWASFRPNEHGMLLVGPVHVREALRSAGDVDLRIALIHHPLESLRDWDRREVQRLLADPRGTHFLVHGHEHQNRVRSIAEPGRGYFEFTTGAGWTSDRYYTGFHSVEVDLAAEQATAYIFRYGEGFWTPDTATYEAVPDGVLRLSLTATPLAAAAAARRVDPDRRGSNLRTLWRLGLACGRQLEGAYIVDDRHEILRWRDGEYYRIEVVQRADAPLDATTWETLERRFPMRGGDSASRVESGEGLRREAAGRLQLAAHARQLRDEYRALGFAGGFLELKAKHASGDAPALKLLEAWLHDPTQALFTLVGEYGAGKTTLTQRWAHDLAERYLADPRSEPAPVRVDLALAGGDDRGPEELVRKALGVTADEASDALVHLAVEQGLLVVVFDGFDEMAARAMDAQTIRAFHSLAALARRPRGKVLFTCRTNSFDTMTSLRTTIRGEAGFSDATLLPLAWGDAVSYLANCVEDQARFAELEARVGPEGIHDLNDLCTRPLLLSMVASLADKVLRIDLGGQRGSYRVDIYREFTDKWADRHADSKTHALGPAQRREFAREMARALWDRNEECYRIHDAKVLRALYDVIGPDGVVNPGVAATEIRTATFFVREGEDRLRFAHRSFLEYFVAVDVWRRLNDPACDPARVLPVRFLSDEVADFLVEMARPGGARPFDQIDAWIRSAQPGIEVAIPIVASYRLHRAELRRDGGQLDSSFRERLRRAWGDALYLTDAQLSGADLSFAHFRGANLNGARLEAARLEDADLRGSDLCGSHLASAILDRAHMAGAAMARAELDEGSLREADLSGVDLRGAKLRAAELRGTVLRDARLDGADLSGARLIGTDLRGVSAVGADLSHALLSRVRTQGLHLKDADLSSSAFHGTELGETRGAPASVRGAERAPRRPRSIELRQPPWRGGGATPSTVAWDSDGTRYAVASWDGVVRLFDADHGRLLTELDHRRGERAGDVGDSAVRGVAFSPDSERVLTACHDGALRLWHIAERAVVRTAERPGRGRVMACAFAADGGRIAGAWSHGLVVILCAWSGAVVAELAHDAGVRDCEFAAADGSLIVTASLDGYARLWDLRSMRERRRFRVGWPLRACAVSRDFALIAAGGEGNAVHVFALSSGAEVAELPHDGWLWSCSFGKSGELATASQDGKARVFGLPSTRPRVEIDQGNWVWDVAFSRDGTRLITCGDDGTVRLYRGDVPDRKVPHGFWARGCAVSPDARWILAACNDRAARLFDAATGRLVQEWQHGSWVRACAFSRDSLRVLTVGGDGYLRLFDIGGDAPRLLEDHGTRIRAGAIAASRDIAATGCADGTVRVFDLRGKRWGTYVLDSEIWSCSFGSDGRHLLVGCDDGSLRWLDVESSAVPAPLVMADGWIRATACSPCGCDLAAGSRRGLQVWRFDGKPTDPVAVGPRGLECWSCAFSPLGDSLLSAWADAVVRLYRMSDRQLIGEFAHPGWAWATAFFPCGTRFLTGCDDGRLRVYKFTGTGGRFAELGLTIAAAFPVPHGQSPDGYFSLPERSEAACDVVCDEARYPLELLRDVINRPDLVAARLRGEAVPDVAEMLAREFPAVAFPTTWIAER